MSAESLAKARLEASLPAVRPHGSLAAIATPTLDLDPVLDSNLSFHGILIENDRDRMRSLGRLLVDGTIRSIVSAVFSPEPSDPLMPYLGRGGLSHPVATDQSPRREAQAMR